MTFLQFLRLACVSALAVILPAHAESFASSASSAGSASSGSVSDSLHGSSHSSDGHDKVAEGDYRILELNAAPGKTGIANLTLQAAGMPERVVLDLPQSVVEQRGLAPGGLVHAQQRSYGIEFASADTREPFFLVLADAVYGELASRPVSL